MILLYSLNMDIWGYDLKRLRRNRFNSDNSGTWFLIMFSNKIISSGCTPCSKCSDTPIFLSSFLDFFRVGRDAAWPSLHGSWLLFEIEHMSTTCESVWKFKGNSVDRHVPYWDGQFRGWSPIPHRPRLSFWDKEKLQTSAVACGPVSMRAVLCWSQAFYPTRPSSPLKTCRRWNLPRDTPVDDGLGYPLVN